MPTYDPTPASAAALKNHTERGRSRVRIHATAYHRVSRHAIEPSPTITSNARCTMLASTTLGRASALKVERPRTTVSGEKPASSELSVGIDNPNTTRPSPPKMPPRTSGLWLCVVHVISIAANLAG